MEREEFVKAMDAVAPLRLAEEWDNVGLLLEPSVRRPIQRVHLTIDLTGPVFDEAIERGADAIVAYHPPIFSGLKRLTQASARHRTLLGAIEHGIVVFSPHTALDSTVGGVNDWLAKGLGPGHARPIVPTAPASGGQEGEGQGRLVTLKRPAELSTLLKRLKAHLKLRHLRVAEAPRHRAPRGRKAAQAGPERITTVALCPGAGGGLLGRVAADLYLTGEMRHHDVLELMESGASVVLTEHTNCERGYLPLLARRLRARAGRGLTVTVSEIDADPLVVR